ncbi:hypothetical protein AMS68_006013 [Peltaster fructicola]|uniref:Uncharacterized protein n=1 Tax=Peltaster fructicola TaxID=286661 RepID=A0A6H0Y0N9_9PEZI|nr:hypothetical protein AMS68_006013 [Peltaster fructicola]
MAVSPMARPQLVSGGKYANIFQPPAPSPVTSTPPQNDYFSSNSRKRQRAGSSMGKSTCGNHDWRTRSPSEDITFSTESLHVNDRYKLKGGFDTPGLLATELDTPADLDINARRMTRDPEPTMRISDPSFAGPLARERNGFARKPVARNGAEISPSWTRYALTLPFSLAGKVFSFGTTVLKGFYAGGGQGFELDGRWHADQETPIPGSFYESAQQDYGFVGDFEQDNNTPTSRPPPNKRRLTDRDSWVMVGTPDLEATTPASPKRRPTLSGLSRRPANLRTTSRKALSRRQSYNTALGSPPILSVQISEPARISLPISPTRHSPRSAFQSPEAERFARRQAKQERVTDKAMNNMSRQLEELIRQGQAALGTKFTVEDNGFDDEGFVDEY